MIQEGNQLPAALAAVVADHGIQSVTDLRYVPLGKLASIPGMNSELMAMAGELIIANQTYADDSLHIDELDLSVRARNALGRNGVETLGDLRELSPARLHAMANVGTKTIEDITSAVMRFDADWGSKREGFTLESTNPAETLADFRGSEKLRRQIKVIALRDELTLEEIALEEGVTRERIRQIEERGKKKIRDLFARFFADELDGLMKALKQEVLSTEQAGALMGDSLVEIEDREFIVAILRSIGAIHPKVFQTRLMDWWAHDTLDLNRYFSGLAEKLAPCRTEVVTKHFQSAPFPSDFPGLEAMTGKGSPVMLHPATGDLVRRSARHRDACFILLSYAPSPLTTARLADALEMKPHAVAESLRRDERFFIQRPQGIWMLASRRPKGKSTMFNTTLEAAMHVLDEYGPIPYDEFEEQVRKIYAVSPGAVRNVLSHRDIGKTTEGLVDLVSRGGTHIEDSRPPQPSHIAVDDETGAISFTVPVDNELLRGSGINLHRFIAWHLGLRSAPAEMSFTAGDSDIRIFRGVNGTTMSSLRSEAVQLGLGVGDCISVTLATDTKSATLEAVDTP